MLTANMIETVILDNIRRNDILMSYAPNKYFLLMYDTNIKSVETLWEKLAKFPSKNICRICKYFKPETPAIGK